MPDLKNNKPGKYNKYVSFTKHDCANSNQVYELSHVYQSRLRKMLQNRILLPFFSLSCQPRLEDPLYERLKQWAEIEDTLIIDNTEAIKKEIMALETEWLTVIY